MQAVQISNYISDLSKLELNSVPKPSVPPGYALVKVVVASVIPLDVAVLKGYLAQLPWVTRLPHTPGYEYSGIVEEIGEDVTNVAVGDAVATANFGIARHDDGDSPVASGLAEYALIIASKLSKKPANVPFAVAAGLPVAVTTAFRPLYDVGKVDSSSKILIFGGSSSVGLVAIQFAKLLGAYVVTTSSGRSRGFTEQFGPDKIIDYTVSDWSEDPDVKGFDLILDCIGEKDGLEKAVSKGTVKPDGIYYSIANPAIGYNPAGHPPLKFGANTAMIQSTPTVDEALRLVSEGKLVVPVEAEFPFTLEGVIDALKRVESGKSLGKNVVRFSPDPF
eukprot:gene7283-9925_t